ncbi:MAG: patatin-like phospholipase family protein, partial [bacterium]
MSETANAHRWKDALGVLPLETVLAQEHDRIHGDDVSALISRIPITFDAGQVISPAAFTHRLLRAWRPLRAAGARPSGDAIDASPIVADEAPLDGVAIYVVAAISNDLRHAVYKALERCQAARDAYDSQPPTAPGERAHIDYARSAEVTRADAALVEEMIPHLNHLLDQPLEEQRAFAPFIDAGAIDALGDHDKNTEQRQRRLLLEAAFDGQIRRIRDVRLDEVFKRVRRHDTAALCLSGGGIRSATFAIGVIRALAHFGLLSKFDYLSTVSGGGYAGSWLSAWMHHTSAHEVQEELRHSGREKLAPEPQPMQHLRRYSHFLTPRVGMFSTDTWTLLATIGRNLLLNWLVLIPLIAAALLLPRFVVSILRIDTSELLWPLAGHERPVLLGLFALGLTLGIWASRYVHRSRPDALAVAPTEEQSRSEAARIRRGTQREFIRNCFFPLVAAALILTTALYLWWTWGTESPRIANLLTGMGPLDTAVNRGLASDPLDRVSSIFGVIRLHRGMVWAFIGSGIIVHVGGWLISGRIARHAKELVTVSISGIIAGTVGMLVGVWFLSRPGTLGREMLFATLAPPAFLGVMLVGSQIFTAFSSTDASDAEREWVTRFNAWLLIAIVTWAALCALTLYGPQWASDGWQQLTLAGLGGASGIVAVLLAKGESNARPGMSGAAVTILRKGGLALAAPLFVGCIIVALAAGNERLIGTACELPMSARTLDCRPKRPRPDDLSHSLPFVVIARHLTDRVDTLSTQFALTNTDGHILLAFERSDSIAQALVARGDMSAPSWDALASVTATEVAASAAFAKTTDSVLRAQSSAFTRAVLATDSATVQGIGGDSVLRALFSKRALAEVRASDALHDRLLARDSAAVLMDEHLTNIEKAAARAQVSPESMTRPWMLGTLHDVVGERLRGSIGAFEQVKQDSIARAKSHDGVESAVTLAGQQVPFDGAVPGTVLFLFFALAGLGLLLGWKIDTNKFSLRAMYEMRLVRAY